MDLSKVSKEKLLEELEKRRKEDIPKSLTSINTAKLEKTINQYFEFLVSDDYCEDNDWDNEIFEMAVATFYGPDIWDWINKQLK